MNLSLNKQRGSLLTKFWRLATITLDSDAKAHGVFADLSDAGREVDFCAGVEFRRGVNPLKEG
jgi:hypothetical protein